EAANLGAENARGLSMGLNISLPFEQPANAFQTEDLAFTFHYFFVRKFWFAYMAKALIVFPGGYGTLDELFELLTLVQTQKKIEHIPIVLYGRKYWKRLINFDFMEQSDMITNNDKDLFYICDDIDTAFKYVTKHIGKMKK
ncbi:LOG family protein, partial [bacterium]